MKHPQAIWVAAAVLSGCVQTPIAIEPPAASAQPVLCVNRSQCDVYWQRAQAWVANNSVYRLQTVTDTVLETAGPQPARYDHPTDQQCLPARVIRSGRHRRRRSPRRG